jgi:hypothetical protein
MPTLGNEQMHNRSLESRQFTHKIGANVVLFVACATGAKRTIMVHLQDTRTNNDHFSHHAPA